MARIVQIPLVASGWMLACLCAEWCGTCGEYRAAFEGVAAKHPDCAFAWVDIEHDAGWMGDIDVENFPTILIAREGEAHFFGTVLPHAEQLSRLLASTRENQSALRAPDADVLQLVAHLRHALLEGAAPLK